jgi:hypothetical protein
LTHCTGWGSSRRRRRSKEKEEIVEGLDRRARKRYQLLSELYAATRLAARSHLGANTTIPSTRKRKGCGEAGGKAAVVSRYRDQS